MLSPCSHVENVCEHEPKRCLLACDSVLAVMRHVISDAGCVSDDVHGTSLHAQAPAEISLEQPTQNASPLPMKHPAKAAEGSARWRSCNTGTGVRVAVVRCSATLLGSLGGCCHTYATCTSARRAASSVLAFFNSHPRVSHSQCSSLVVTSAGQSTGRPLVVAASLVRSGAGICPRAYSHRHQHCSWAHLHTARGHTGHDARVICPVRSWEGRLKWEVMESIGQLERFALCSETRLLLSLRVPCFTLPRLSLSPFFLRRVAACCLSAFLLLFFLRKLRSRYSRSCSRFSLRSAAGSTRLAST